MRERFGWENPEERKSSTPSGSEQPAAKISASDFETAKEAIDLHFENFLETHAERMNEGNNGIILKLDIRDMAPDVNEAFKAAGLDLGTEQVAKVLKVYSRGRGKMEFDLQKYAFDVANGLSNDAPHARVPTPRYFADIPLSIELKEKLRRTSEGFSATDRIEILLMDEVKGADVATQLYREVVRRHPKSAHLSETADSLEIETLIDEVTRVLEFKVPGGKARSDAERAWEEEKVNNENLKSMIGWLEKKGFQVEPKIVEAISNTMDAFHDNGLAFRDAHPRNVMVEGSIEAGKADDSVAYIIDFGSAVRFEGKFNDAKEGLFNDEVNGRRYPSDELTVNMLKPLATAPAERSSAAEKAYLIELAALKKRMGANKNPKLKSFMDGIPDMVLAGAQDQAKAHALIAASPAAQNVDYLLAPLADMIETGGADADSAKSFLLNLQPKLKTEDQNKVARFLKHLK